MTLPPVLRAAAVLAAALLLLPGAGPAAAHEGDPRVVTVLSQVQPALPAAVEVQVQANLAAQLVVRNPTATVLEVLGTGDRPFLRISSAGVLADVAGEDFFTTSSPTGAAPRRPSAAAAKWVRISAGDSWGWYDHRLHPDEVVAPPDPARPARLATWQVPLRYGGSRSVASGSVEFRPLLGAFQVSAAAAPGDLQVQALPGRLPGLFVANPSGTPLTVLGRDGEPFLRFTAAGVEVNERSRTHVEDRQARGEQAGPPGPVPSFRAVPGASSYTWLDARLRYAQDLPPERALRASRPTVVERWRVPVEVAGSQAALTGDITWVPEASAAQTVSGGPAPSDEGRPVLPVALGLGALVVLAAAVLLVRRART